MLQAPFFVRDSISLLLMFKFRYKRIWPSIMNQLQQKVSMSIKALGIYIACFIILFTLTYLFGVFEHFSVCLLQLQEPLE